VLLLAQLLEKMKINKQKLLTILLLGVILIIALFVRMYSLSTVPNGFHIDEASLGYNGYSLLLTGKDENNNKFPLYINMFGDERPSGYHYLTILPIKVLGLNEFATRLPGALFGTLTVISFFFLTLVLFKNKKLSLLSALLVAIAPWQVVLSRASAETIVALFFIISGYIFVLLGFKKQRGLYFFVGAFIMLLSFFFYHTPRVFVPLLFLATIAYLYPVWKRFKMKERVSLVASFLILSFVSFALVFIVPGGTGRYSQVNIFGYPAVKLVLAEQIVEGGLMHAPADVTRIFHNKVINYSLAAISNYSDYFTGKFLFMEGGLPNWYRVPDMGLIYLVELPFILIGIFYLIISKDRYHKLPLLWLLLAPLVAAFTVDDTPNLQRAIVMFPMIELFAAYGFIMLLNKFAGIKSKILLIVVALLLLFNFAYFLQEYFIQAQVDKNWYRNEGFGQMVKLVKKDYANYDKIFVTKSYGGIYPLILFYMQYDPSTYQKEGSTKDKEYTGFGKFYFLVSACPSAGGDPKVPKVKKAIYIDNGTCPNYEGLQSKKYSYITRKDGTRVFRMVYD